MAREARITVSLELILIAARRRARQIGAVLERETRLLLLLLLLPTSIHILPSPQRLTKALSRRPLLDMLPLPRFWLAEARKLAETPRSKGSAAGTQATFWARWLVVELLHGLLLLLNRHMLRYSTKSCHFWAVKARLGLVNLGRTHGEST